MSDGENLVGIFGLLLYLNYYYERFSFEVADASQATFHPELFNSKNQKYYTIIQLFQSGKSPQDDVSLARKKIWNLIRKKLKSDKKEFEIPSFKVWISRIKVCSMFFLSLFKTVKLRRSSEANHRVKLRRSIWESVHKPSRTGNGKCRSA